MKLNRVSKLTFLISVAGTAAAIGCSAGSSSSSDGGDGDTDGGDTGGDGDLCVINCDGTGDGDIGEIEDPNKDLPAPPNCGDGILDPDEVCDDGGLVADDGCYANCLGIDPGYICPEAGQACFEFAVCGDGLSRFPEQCDDGNTTAGDGCSDNCKIEIGFKCDTDNAPCTATTCGDGVVEGAEMCEPGVTEGCTASCQFAPDCSGGACTSSCGDGLVLGEDCDDGNTLDGDGCSSTCTTEDGYTCTNESTSGECETSPDTGECILRIPVTYRDFPDSHVAFGTSCGNTAPVGQVKTGMVETTLNASGNPVPTGDQDCSSTMGEWYDDSASSATFNSEIVLYESSGSYVNRWGAAGEQFFWTTGWSNSEAKNCAMDPCGPYDGNPFFYPVDAMPDPMDMVRVAAEIYDGDNNTYGGGGQGVASEATLTGVSTPHNYGFTSEIAYWFAFDADTNATLDFAGDDDVWVFVNNQLAVDLGGKHSAAQGSVTLSGASPAYGMTPGNVYEIKVFHAERQPTGSTFKLTLSGFDTSRSDCRATCGDGVVAFGEQCDEGEGNGEGYNQCGTDCRLGSYCGDGIVDEGEVCDDADTSEDADPSCTNCRIVVVR